MLGPGREERHADPLRQPQGGRRRTASPTPSAPTTSTAARRSSSTWAPRPPSTPSPRPASTSAGAITPGVAISLEALFQHAAALRRVELVEPRDVIGRSTVESIQSGVLYGFAAQVDGLCRRIVAELGQATVVATGGLAELIAPYTESVEHVEPWLTLHGLRIVYERNVDGPAPVTRRPRTATR